MKFVQIPFIVRSVFFLFTWRIKTRERAIYLTFDDGPTPEVTPWVLDILDQFNAKATFFCIGKNVENHPEIYNVILRRGHSVGNHTYSHIKYLHKKNDEFIADVQAAHSFISSDLFRPPYGKLSLWNVISLIRKYKIVYWTQMIYDWEADIDRDFIIDSISKNAKSGDIILMHDSVKSADNLKVILPLVLHNLSNDKYLFKKIENIV
jgi:peptidoglycan-N-acetylglucosamine deacetylase